MGKIELEIVVGGDEAKTSKIEYVNMNALHDALGELGLEPVAVLGDPDEKWIRLVFNEGDAPDTGRLDKAIKRAPAIAAAREEKASA
jgi:hypothetical protein